MSIRKYTIACMTVLCAAGLAACDGKYRPQNTWTNYYDAAHDTKDQVCTKKNPSMNKNATDPVTCKEPIR